MAMWRVFTRITFDIAICLKQQVQNAFGPTKGALSGKSAGL